MSTVATPPSQSTATHGPAPRTAEPTTRPLGPTSSATLLVAPATAPSTESAPSLHRTARLPPPDCT